MQKLLDGMIAHPRITLINNPKYSEMLKVIGSLWEIPPEVFLSNSHSHKFSAIRQVFMKCLYEFGMSYSDIAKETFHHHTTIMHSIQTIENIMKYDAKIRSLYNTTLEALYAMQSIKPLTDKHFNKKVYLCGKVTGLDEDKTRLKFNKAEKELMKTASSVVNPYQFCLDRNVTGWNECMKILLPELLSSEIVVILPDARESRGALWEIAIAKHIMGINAVEMK